MNQNVYCQDDEIDLRELWQTLIKRKALIAIVTCFVTICATIFTFVQMPLYEVKTVVDIGFYGTSLLEEPANLVKRVEIKYINNENKEAITRLDTVTQVKGAKDLVELTAIAPSNEEAKSLLNAIVQDIKNRHHQLLQSYVGSVQAKIQNLENQKKDLEAEQKQLALEIAHKTANIDQIIKDNPAVAAVYTIELNSKTTEFSDLKNKIFMLNNQLSDLSLAISSSNIQDTNMMDKMMFNDFPTKPKKKMIVTVALVSGIIVSIFLAFFLEFIGKNRHE